MIKILKPSDLAQYPPQNSKGEWATYIDGVFQGYAPMVPVASGHKFILLPVHVAPIFVQMVADAAKDGVLLTAEKGFVTMQTQIEIRKRFIRPKYADKINDLAWLLSANVDCFYPQVGYPGSSNHQNIIIPAIDFNVTKTDKFGNRIGNLPSYPWLVKNAMNYGMLRTIVSERWHHEHRPTVTDQFFKVPKNHPTWDGLV